MSRYLQLQEAVSEARKRYTPEPSPTRFQRCVHLLGHLGDELRKYLGLSPTSQHVFFCRPGSRNPRPEQESRALDFGEQPNEFRAELTVIVKDRDGRNEDHGLYATLVIQSLGATSYRIDFAEDGGPEVVEVDSADPSTYTQFCANVFDAMLAYYNSLRLDVERPPIGFKLRRTIDEVERKLASSSLARSARAE